MNSSTRILVIHGPNLNMLGRREPSLYGSATLEEINDMLYAKGKALGAVVETFQSNHEGAIIDKIQASLDTVDGVIINPAAYTHTSIAIRDALLLLNVPIIEVHLSDVYQRESFRQVSMISDVAAKTIAGKGPRGYVMAMEAIMQLE